MAIMRVLYACQTVCGFSKSLQVTELLSINHLFSKNIRLLHFVLFENKMYNLAGKCSPQIKSTAYLFFVTSQPNAMIVLFSKQLLL